MYREANSFVAAIIERGMLEANVIRPTRLQTGRRRLQKKGKIP